MTPYVAKFTTAANPRGQRTPFAYAYDKHIRDVQHLLGDSPDLNAHHLALKDLFRDFLVNLDMPLAVKNFDALLREKSGDKFLRDDGTVNWYHEYIPLLMMIGLVRYGYKKGGVDIKELEPYGGLEVMICTHLRHDSVEDFTSDNEMMREQQLFVEQIHKENPAYDFEQGNAKALQTIINIDLMTQKKITLPDGSTEKEEVVPYIYRMVNSEYANPIVFMLKQADVIHNFATLFGAKKFTAERRLKRCDEREDMYGPRYGFTDTAIEQWRPFRNAIGTLDSMMGIMLYPHFRYLESVDLHYKKPYDIPVGIGRYLRGAVNVKLPGALNPLHIFMNRLATSVDPQKEPEKYERLEHFMENVIKKPLEPYRDRFTYLFTKAPVRNTSPNTPIAMPEFM